MDTIRAAFVGGVEMIPAFAYATHLSDLSDTMVFFWALHAYLILGAVFFIVGIVRGVR